MQTFDIGDRSPPALTLTNQQEIDQMTTIAERAMLAELSISQWSARRLDRKVTDEVHSQHGAAADAGRYNKALLSKDALAAIQTAVSGARFAYYRLTLPWNDAGARILSARAYLEFTAAMRPHREAFERAVSDFLANYDDYKDDARRRLNGLFSEDDYPHRDEIERRFSFSVNVWPMPDAGDFRADLTAEQVEAIRADIEKRARDQIERAIGDAWQRVAERVGHMIERLTAYDPSGDKAKGVFRDSLVENVRDLVDTLPALNFTNDPRLAEIAERMRAELCTLSADELRQSPTARAATVASARDILASVSDFLA